MRSTRERMEALGLLLAVVGAGAFGYDLGRSGAQTSLGAAGVALLLAAVFMLAARPPSR